MDSHQARGVGVSSSALNRVVKFPIWSRDGRAATSVWDSHRRQAEALQERARPALAPLPLRLAFVDLAAPAPIAPGALESLGSLSSGF